jgi:mono/diheme cytochrome c family protein/peroxiredoxin
VASVNRTRLTPQLVRDPAAGRSRMALRQLARNSAIEAGLGALVLVIVGILGTTPPGLHMQPVWPFPFRFDSAAGEGPALRAALGFIVAAILAGILLTTGRLPRWISILGCLIAAMIAVFSLRAFTVPAFPTSYDASPTGYTAASIARGRTLFDQHCVRCHGASGNGEGPALKGADAMSADLTADHVYSHTDGDLFWWISHGIDDVMPSFAADIDDDGRWSLIDFVHANADGAHLRKGAANAGFPVPDFSADCPDGRTVSLTDLRGSMVHLVVAGPNSAQRLQHLAHTHIAHDLVTVEIASAELAQKDVPFCATQDEAVSAAFAVYRGANQAASEGSEFLIDAGGQLRAVWYPGLAPAWTDDDVLRQRLTEIRNVAAAPRAAAPHAHMHMD